MTDYTAHDIHQLDQAYPAALASIEHLTGDPARKRRLADVGAEVFAAELTRELDATFDSGMSLAGWAAIATVRLMEAGRAWEEDTDMAWAKVDELTAELAGLRADVESLTDDLSAVRTERDAIAAWANQTGAAAKVVDALRDYILNAIKGDGLDAAEMHDIAGDLASVLGHLGHPVANEDGCDCESYDCKGQCCGVGNCTCTPARPIVTVELPAEAVAR